MLQGSRIVEQAAADLNELVHLPDTITIRFGAADGPHYDPNIGEIWFPYEFAALVGQLFADSDYVETQDELETAILDTVEFVLFHEIGHALIHQLELPVTGKEEDAVDMLAAILLVESREDGGEIALNAANAFDLFDAQAAEFVEDDFWGEHSLDVQRFYSINCLIYGADPENYAELPAQLDWPDDRAERCIADYAQQAFSWSVLLEPYLKVD